MHVFIFAPQTDYCDVCQVGEQENIHVYKYDHKRKFYANEHLEDRVPKLKNAGHESLVGVELNIPRTPMKV